MDVTDVADKVMKTGLGSELHREDFGITVRLYLKNGYGISVARSSYGDELPMVAPIRRSEDGTAGFTFAWLRHPDFAEIRCSERCCTPERAVEILMHLKGVQS